MNNEQSISQSTIRNILNHDFVLAFFASFAFLATNSALYPTLPIYLEQLGSNETQVGVLVGSLGVASLVSRPLVGRILLKSSEKSVMMVGAVLSVFAFLAFMVFRPFWPILIVRFLQGVSLACIDTAVLASIIKVIPATFRGQGISYFMLAPSLSTAIAPSLGMFLINHYSFAVLFLACAGLSSCTFLFVYKLRGGRGMAESDIGVLTHNGCFVEWKIVVPALTSFLQHFAWGTLVAFLPLYAIQRGITNPGLFFSAMAVMIIAGRALGGRVLNTFSKEKIIKTFIFTAIVALVILSFAKTLPMVIFVGLLWGIGAAFFVPISMAYALEYAGSSDGTAVGTFRAISDLGLALGPIVMGIVVPLTGYRVMFLCLAFVCFIDLCYFQFYVNRKK